MNDSLKVSDLAAALCLTHVSILSGAARRWRMLNSVAYATLPMSAAALVKHDLDGKAGADLKVSVNFIHVHGPRPPGETLHYHTAGIIGIVTFGSGFVDHVIDGVETTTVLTTMDIVIIPRGALHTFHCKEGETVDYAVLEIGPDVDGQAHHYLDAESH